MNLIGLSLEFLTTEPFVHFLGGIRVKQRSFRAKAFALVLGSFFGISLFALFGFGNAATATDYCPDTIRGKTACTGGYCFTSITGQKSCRYHQPECNGGACTPGP